jgi:hypothetical protein
MGENKKYEAKLDSSDPVKAMIEVAKALSNIANELKRANDIKVYERIHAENVDDFWVAVKEGFE